MSLCVNAKDEIIQDKPIWIVTLNTGRKIFQDDGRPGEDEPSAWIRLKQYLDDNKHLYIDSISLKFGSHIINNFIPPNVPAIYFSKAIITTLDIESKECFIVGFQGGDVNKFFRYWYILPELECIKSDEMHISKLFSNCIIKRKR